MPGFGNIPDSAMDKLRKYGGAKVFDMTSSWRMTLIAAINVRDGTERWIWRMQDDM